MYTQGRFHGFRTAAVKLNRLQRPPVRNGDHDSVSLQPVRIAEAVERLKRDGAYEDLHLQESALCELRDFCENSECFGSATREYPFHWSERAAAEELYGRRLPLGWYSDVTARCAAANRLANDAALWSIARGYFGSEPALIGARAWWSFAAAGEDGEVARNGQAFHFDLDGYRALSFFFYLTEVDMEGGPHIFVRGSHRRKRLSHLLSLHKSRPDAEIEAQYSSENIRPICGKAGTGFAEDTFCFHKGLIPQSRVPFDDAGAFRIAGLWDGPDVLINSSVDQISPLQGRWRWVGRFQCDRRNAAGNGCREYE